LNNEGHVIRRPFHKFFNYKESESILKEQSAFRGPFNVIDKMDGSMIAPFLSDGEIIWGTKMAAPDFHEEVADFVNHSDAHYRLFTLATIGYNATPIFEWISPDNRIVVKYKEPKLVLTGVRHNITGKYASYKSIKRAAESCDFEVAPLREFSTIENVVEHNSDTSDEEGHIVFFSDGNMLKIKSDWYIDLHKMKENVHRDHVLSQIILRNELDDLLPKMDEHDLQIVKETSDELDYIMTYMIDNLNKIYDSIDKDSKDAKKNFALDENISKENKTLIFSIWNRNLNASDVVKQFLLSSASKEKRWKDFKNEYFS
jgi:RNA ligase